MPAFIKRHIAKAIQDNLTKYPSITLQGPRQCGKTTLLKQLFPDFSYADLDDPNTRDLAQSDPYEFFKQYPEPVILDEIQRCPSILSLVKVRIDQRHECGKYIISGSAQLKLRSSVTESLAGRTALLTMYPLSLSELKEAGIILDRDTQLLYGFLPELYSREGLPPYDYYVNYLQTYVERDISSETQVRDRTAFENFLRITAGRIGQLADYTSMANDTGVSSTTVKHWLSLLEASYVIYRLPSWQKSRVSRAVKAPKLYFADTGLAAALLGLKTPGQLVRDPLRGNLFENLAVMEAVKTKTSRMESTPFYFFRNSRGQEIDLVQEEPSSLRLFEIKSSERLDPAFVKPMDWFEGSNGRPVESKNIIYAGENGSLAGARLTNFHDIGTLFPEEERFILKGVSSGTQQSGA